MSDDDVSTLAELRRVERAQRERLGEMGFTPEQIARATEPLVSYVQEWVEELPCPCDRCEERRKRLPAEITCAECGEKSAPTVGWVEAENGWGTCGHVLCTYCGLKQRYWSWEKGGPWTPIP